MKRACIFDIISTRSSSDIPPAKSVSRRQRVARNTAMAQKYGALLPPIMLPVTFVTSDHRITRRNDAEKNSKVGFKKKKIGEGGEGAEAKGDRGGRSCPIRTEIHAFGHTNTPLLQPSVDALRLLLLFLGKEERDRSKSGICQTYLKSKCSMSMRPGMVGERKERRRERRKGGWGGRPSACA